MFFHPTMLPCQHTFCVDCIIQSCKTKFVKTIDCPICRQTTKLPKGSIKNLSINRLIIDLLDQNGHKGRTYEANDIKAKLKKARQLCRDTIVDDSSSSSSSESEESSSDDSGTHSAIDMQAVMDRKYDSDSSDDDFTSGTSADGGSEDSSDGSSESITGSGEKSSSNEEYTPE